MKDNAKKELTTPAKTPQSQSPQSSRSRCNPQLVQPPEILDMEVLSGRLDKTTANIRKEIGNVTKSFCRIGFELWMAKENKLYLGQGFGSVYEYSEKLLGFQKTSTAGYIAVCEKFSIIKNGKPTAQLDSEYSKFSYSQLSLMLSLPSKKLGEITPDKTCKEIREIKKSVKNTAVGSPVPDVGNPPAASVSVPSPAASVSAPSPAAEPRAGLLFAGVLKKEDIALIISQLRKSVGCEITITVEKFVEDLGENSNPALESKQSA